MRNDDRSTETWLTCLLIDDEPCEHLRLMLEEQDVRIVGKADNAAWALQLVRNLVPDLLFVVIKKPELPACPDIEALQRQDTAPLLVFVTSNVEHAVYAFDLGALDCLITPFAPERLATTVMRARRRLSEQHRDEARPSMLQRATAPPCHRLPVREGFTVQFLRIEEILYVKATQKRTSIVSLEGEFRTDYTLTQLETLLPEDRFRRVHDSWLVNLNLIGCIHFQGNHSYAVQLLNGMRIPVGRTRYAELLRCLQTNTASK